MDLDDIALFRSIATAGSLSAAARQMGLTPMTVSRRLTALETEIGARLIHRTTRSLSLTPEGEAFLPFATQLLETQDQALAALAMPEGGLSGVLKLTAPNLIGRSIVVPVVAELMAANPGLRVDLTLTDGVVDIAAAGIDVAIRVASLQPSDMIATRVVDNPRVLCAAPAYLEKHGRPESLAELAGHACLQLHAMDHWPFIVAGATRRVSVDGPLAANSVDALRAACLLGAGIAMVTYWDAWEQLERGELERITLADAEPDRLAIWAVYPSRRHTPPRVPALVEALRARLSQRRGAPAPRDY
jgi:DNA-binding transcriptional LysR family regulator